jgi:Na+-transporting methylmalonyl-CoA/oxaloacetate decarboxylase gamma subunit
MDYLKELSESGQLTYLGLAISVIGLILLIVCLRLVSRIVAAINGGAKGAGEPALETAAFPVVQTVERGIDPQIIAVIAASIAAMSESGKTLVVRSVKKSAGWQRAARNEQVSRF